MGKTKIEWADRTWNPVTGCTPISAGCQNCYAKRMATRLQAMGQKKYENGFKVTCHPEALNEPLKWKKPSKVFVCSMSDLFHEDVPDDFIVKVFETMSNAQWFFGHTFLVLTKRPERMKFIIDQIQATIEDQKKGTRNADGTTTHKLHFAFPLQNIWLGVTAENQEQADKRIPILLQTPAAKRFVSVEPMLRPVDLNQLAIPGENYMDFHVSALHEQHDDCFYNSPSQLDWVICGGESGPNARPMHSDWTRSLRDQCRAAGTPFLFKQWGEWYGGRGNDKIAYSGPKLGHDKVFWLDIDGNRLPIGKGHCTGQIVARVGKKAAGRLLDGELWDQYPDGGND